jgi:D-3-phosphoglycerate dehydrogenase
MELGRTKVLWCWVEPPCLAEFLPESKVEMIRPKGLFPPASEDELIQLVAPADFLVVRRYFKITEPVIKAGKNLKAIYKLGRRAQDAVDLEAAERAGVPVISMSMNIDSAVAEHTIMLMLALAKRLVHSHNFVVNGDYARFGLVPEIQGELSDVDTKPSETLAWNTVAGPVDSVFHKTLGLVGMGDIGTQVADRARGFGMRILYYKRQRLSPADEKQLGVSYVSYEELLRQSDYVSLHVPHTIETDKILGREQIALMKPTARVINVSRGAIIDEDALCDALKNKRIAGAGLEVFLWEPVPKGNPLLSLDNVICTPHNAVDWPNGEHVRYDYQRIGEDLLRMSQGEKPIHGDRVAA